MIALVYNQPEGGAREYWFREANSTELQLGLKYMANEKFVLTAASILSTGAYSPDGLVYLYVDQRDPSLPIWYRSSAVTAGHLQPYGGISFNPGGHYVSFAGFGPKQKLLYAVFRQQVFKLAKSKLSKISRDDLYKLLETLGQPGRWFLRLYPKQLTFTPGYCPVHAPLLERIFFVEAGDNNTIRSTNESGGNGLTVHQFKDGTIRALAITQDPSASASSKWEVATFGDELLVSVYDPSQAQSVIYAGRSTGHGMRFSKRFTVNSDWVMVAGTGAFGGGTRILFTDNYTLKVWDNRDSRVYPVLQWETKDGINHYTVPLPNFRHYLHGSGLALSRDTTLPMKKQKTSSAAHKRKAQRIAPRRKSN
jgi:hypothetical protein